MLSLFLGSLLGGLLLASALVLGDSLGGSLLGTRLLGTGLLGADSLLSLRGGLWLAGRSLDSGDWSGGDVGQRSVVDDLAGSVASLGDSLGDTAGLLALAGRPGDRLAG